MAARCGLSRIDVVVLMLLGGLSLSCLIIFIARLERPRDFVGRTQTFNGLKAITLACHSFQDVHKRIPPAYDDFAGLAASLHVHLLPYSNEESLYKDFVAGKGDVRAIVRYYVSKDDPSIGEQNGVQNFAANLRVFSNKGQATRFDENMPPLAEREPCKKNLVSAAKDGTSVTVFFSKKYAWCADGGSRFDAPPNSRFAAFFGQNAAKIKAHPSDPHATFQLAPARGECVSSPLMAQSFFETGLEVSMGDGSVRFISPDVSPRTWNSALQPNDGNQLGDDW